jgi:magnesium-transporting ATPase (P-type)
MDDAALAFEADHSAIFARVSPTKESCNPRFEGADTSGIGDGINDAPRYTADVGISVTTAWMWRKMRRSSWRRDLAVLGVTEGRRCFALS